MPQMTTHCYITTDESLLHGEAIIAGTRTPVRAIVELWRLGLTPDEIPLHLPHLTLAHVFDALSYYSDHQPEIQAYLDRNGYPLSDSTAHPVLGPDRPVARLKE